MKKVIEGKLNPELRLNIEGDLVLENTPIRKLPDNLTVGGSLYLRGTQIKEIPNNLIVGCNLDFRNTNIKVLPESLKVGGDLQLSNTQVKELPDNLKVMDYLNLNNTPIKELPNNLSVGGSLNLRKTPIKELPDDLKATVLCLEGTNIKNYPVVYNAGKYNRAIYLDLEDKSKIVIGCFKGTKEEAIRAIKQKYIDKEATEYIEKVEECFQMWEDMKEEKGVQVNNGVNNGGKTDYYQIPDSVTDADSFAEWRGLNFAQGNILKSVWCFNTNRHKGTNYERELHKVIHYARRELSRIKNK